MFLGMRFWGIPFSDRLMSHIDQFFSRAGPPAATQESNAQRMQSQNLLQRHDVAKHTATGLDMADMGDADADAGFSSMNMYPSFVPEKGVSFFSVSGIKWFVAVGVFSFDMPWLSLNQTQDGHNGGESVLSQIHEKRENSVHASKRLWADE